MAFKTAPELAALIRAGGVSAAEAVEATLRRIESVDERINAFIEVDGERALAEAAGIARGDPRPFAGVPVAVKANVPVAGLCANYASRLLAGHRPSHSAYLVRRLREAGFVVVGVTNMSEFGILPTTEPRYTGATRNPWNRDRTPGGSSGGSAAAVAAGLVPVAQGNDGGGSIRIPAACCGVVGLKPSRGRISRGPDRGDSFLVCEGVLTRTVLETRAAARRARRLRGGRRDVGAAARRAVRDRDPPPSRPPAGRGVAGQPARTATSIPRACARCARRRASWPSSGTRWSRGRRRFPRRTRSRSSSRSSAPASRWRCCRAS